MRQIKLAGSYEWNVQFALAGAVLLGFQPTWKSKGNTLHTIKPINQSSNQSVKQSSNPHVKRTLEEMVNESVLSYQLFEGLTRDAGDFLPWLLVQRCQTNV
jgi:hypothetical protein